MKNELTYTQVGDVLLPDLTLGEQPDRDLGKYGRMRRTYLKEHRPGLFNRLTLNGTLFSHLLEIEDAANSRLEQMMPELAKAAGVTEQLKASDPMKWVGLMEAIQEAESADAPSAFSIPQAEVDRALRGYGGKLKIFDLYHQNLPARSIVAALQKEYGTSGGSYILSDGSHIFLDYRPNTGMEFWRHAADKKFIVKWPAVEKRIRQLIQEGSYLSAAEMENYLSGHLETAPEQEAEATGPVITDMDVDKLLVEDWGITGRKQRIFALYQQGFSDEQIAEHLRAEYNKHGYTPEERAHEGPCVLADGGEGYGYFVAAEWRLRRRNADGPMRCISYEEMAHHIRGLIDAGRYLTPEELE